MSPSRDLCLFIHILSISLFRLTYFLSLSRLLLVIDVAKAGRYLCVACSVLFIASDTCERYHFEVEAFDIAHP